MKTQSYTENMNLPAIAKYLGVSPVTIKRMLKDREIPAAKVRGQWLFKKSVIDEWLTRNSWSQIKKTIHPAQQEKSASSNRMHPSVARLFAALDRLDFSGLNPAEWDEAKRWLAEEEVKRTQKLIELAERGE